MESKISNNSNSTNSKESKKYNIKLNISDFEQLQTVGVGSFGRVRLCRHKKNSKIYVMKILKKY